MKTSVRSRGAARAWDISGFGLVILLVTLEAGTRLAHECDRQRSDVSRKATQFNAMQRCDAEQTEEFAGKRLEVQKLRRLSMPAKKGESLHVEAVASSEGNLHDTSETFNDEGSVEL